jgi:hypothetical protein
MDPWSSEIPLFQGNTRITVDSGFSGITGTSPKVSSINHGNCTSHQYGNKANMGKRTLMPSRWEGFNGV